ncbi:hypothetical protein PROFUN_02995 [Planoprotostelium fungivorum]|uniref:Uncharacterized protein n=1 Tax=Planoprotostelium fungivorum TaxID=1890364 RepID=A0A2P6NXA0_9EUKA|nr:hypothetical protein PROFUN_02995 [Planoprotostelium fungivorum]
MPLANDPYLALVLSIATSSPETEHEESSESQKEIPSHLDETSASECTIGLPPRGTRRPDPAEEGGLKQLVVPANHFLLSTQRNKPTTASQPQQPWNILTWIFTEAQVATAECIPPQALSRTRTHGLRSFLINNTWASILFGTSLGAKLFTAPPTVTRSTITSSIWTSQHLQEEPHKCTREDKNVSPATSNDQVKRQSQTDNRWMMYGQYAFGQKSVCYRIDRTDDEVTKVIESGRSGATLSRVSTVKAGECLTRLWCTGYGRTQPR